MDNTASPSLSLQLAAAQEWWRDAGVDCDFSDAPANWLTNDAQAPSGPASPGNRHNHGANAPGAATPAAAQALQPKPPLAPGVAPRETIITDPADLPGDLAAFRTWWLTETRLDFGGTSPRILPRGPVNAQLMVMVAEPEVEDQDTILSGPHGALLDAMLQSMGIAADECYVASALPRQTPMVDFAELMGAGLGKILLHHIALAAPKRLLICGRGILPLLGHDPAQKPASLRQVNHGSASIEAMAAFGLGTLLARPASRAGFWQRWLDWTETTSP